MGKVEQAQNTGSDGEFDHSIPSTMITPDAVQGLLEQERRRSRRRIIIAAASAAAVTVTAFIVGGSNSETAPTPPTTAGATDGGNAARQPLPAPTTEIVVQSPEAGLVQGSLCDRIKIGEFLGWTGERRPDAYRPDAAVCSSETTGLSGMALRAHGKWSWEHLQNGNAASPLGYIEIAVYDVTQPDGRSTLSQLVSTYNPPYSRTMEIGGSTVTFASADGRTIVHDASKGIDATITTRLAKGLDSPASYSALEGGQTAALAQLVPVLAGS